MCSFELPTVARTGAAANCASISVKIINTAATGVVGFQQVELLPSLFDNPSFDSGAVADPWLPDGWANYDMDAGDSEIDAGGRSGGNCIEFNNTTSNEGISQVITCASGKFFGMGGWGYGDATSAMVISPSGAHALLQYSAADRTISMSTVAAWTHAKAVWRSLTATPTIFLYGGAGAAGDRFLDDFYAILLDDVTLTATPATLANSLEGTGIRVDGGDRLTMPWNPALLRATKGVIQWNFTPRHAAATPLLFDATPTLLYWRGDANNTITLFWNAVNTLRLSVTSPAGTITGDWDATGAIVAGTSYVFRVKWFATGAQFFVNGGLKIAVALTINFTTLPALVYFGNGAVTSNPDAVYS